MLAAIHAVLNLTDDFTYRVLICTPSHTASDVITRRLGLHLNADELLRLYDIDRPVETVPVEVLRFCNQAAETGAFQIPPPLQMLKYRAIVCTCYDAHLLYRIGMTNQQLRIQRRRMNHYLQSLYAGSNLSISLDGVDRPHFSHLFIDEASQASEPESMIPLSVVVDAEDGVRKVEIVLTGDPKQLSPAVFSNEAAKRGLECSWMERLLLQPIKCLGGGNNHMLGDDLVCMEDWIRYSMLRNGQEQLSLFLTLNYRGHPSFLMVPSALFYADKLHAHDPNDKKRANFWCEMLRRVEALSSPVVDASLEALPEEVRPQKEFGWPIHFRSVVGKDVCVTVNSGFSGSSWANRMEAEVTAEIVATLTSSGVGTQSIGVLSPFRGQVVMIRDLLRQRDLGAVNVGTVEDYQAAEKEVIVLSLTRSNISFVQHDIENRMGLFGQPKRSNVAMTRAECLFIVVSGTSKQAC
jgi:superfamily I DNA and/or RNA helicase